MVYLDLSLAFDALSGLSCGREIDLDDDTDDPPLCVSSGRLCRLQRGLAATLLIALVAWLATFSISVLRIVDRVNRR